jgi:tRNA 2-thiouridine synthesizing protein A
VSAPTRVVDALGTYCPVPIHLLERAMLRTGPGDLLELLADDPLIELDLPAWCHETGHELVELAESEGEYRALIRQR